MDDSVTYKVKKNKKKNKKENISNSSRDSIEKEICSYDSNIISKKASSKGEEIKFFFNPPSSKTIDQKSKSLFSCKTIRKLKDEKEEKNECNFKDILINYMNSPQIKSRKLNEDKEDRRKSIIYEKPDVVLTLHGEEDSNEKHSEKSDKNNDSDSNSNSNSSSSSSFNLNNIKGKNYSKKSESIKDKNNLDNSKESSFKFDINKYKDSSHNSDIEDKNSNSGNNIIFENYKNENNENENENENEKEYNKMISNELKKIQKSDKNLVNGYSIRRESYNNYRPFKNTYTNTNSFTTTTKSHNTHKTQKTNNSSFQSIKLNNKKIKYNYLCWNDLSLQKKLLIKNRSNSVKIIESLKDENKENLINDKTEIMIYKLKHLNISLDKEKSYFYYFRNFTNLKEQVNNYSQKSSEYLNNNDDEEGDGHYNEQFFYPKEFYISKKNSLHNKTHVSNLFNISSLFL